MQEGSLELVYRSFARCLVSVSPFWQSDALISGLYHLLKEADSFLHQGLSFIWKIELESFEA
jgi:hypothetical protein